MQEYLVQIESHFDSVLKYRWAAIEAPNDTRAITLARPQLEPDEFITKVIRNLPDVGTQAIWRGLPLNQTI